MLQAQKSPLNETNSDHKNYICCYPSELSVVPIHPFPTPQPSFFVIHPVNVLQTWYCIIKIMAAIQEGGQHAMLLKMLWHLSFEAENMI